MLEYLDGASIIRNLDSNKGVTEVYYLSPVEELNSTLDKLYDEKYLDSDYGFMCHLSRGEIESLGYISE